MLLPGSAGIFASCGFLAFSWGQQSWMAENWLQHYKILFPLTAASEILSGGNQTELEVKIKNISIHQIMNEKLR